MREGGRMIAVHANHVGRVAPTDASPTAPSTAAKPEGDNQALLPSAPYPTTSETADALSELYKILSNNDNQEMRSANENIKQNERLHFAAHKEHAAALERAKKAAEEQKEASKGPMDWVTDDIGVMGVAGLCTFNYPLVIADVAVHKLGLVENLKIDVVDAACAFALQYGHPELLVADLVARHPEILPGELHDKIASVASFSRCLDDKTLNPSLSDKDVEPYSKQILAANLVVASAAITVCTLGAASPLASALAIAAIACSVAAYTAENVEPVHDLMEKNLGKETTGHVILGLQIGSAVLGVASAGVGTAAAVSGSAGTASKATEAMKFVKLGANLGKGALEVEGAVRSYRAAEAQRDIDHARIDMKAARNRMQQLERAVDTIIDGLKEAHESGKRALETLQNTIQIQDQIPVQIAGAMKA